MADRDRLTLPVSAAPAALMFPTLTPAQIARIGSHGVVRRVARGDVLVEAGDSVVPFFVIAEGEIEIIRSSTLGDTLVAIHHPGHFTGEANMLLGRRSLMRARVSEPGEVGSSRRDPICRPPILLPPSGRLRDLHTCSKPRFLGFSPWAT